MRMTLEAISLEALALTFWACWCALSTASSGYQKIHRLASTSEMAATVKP